MTEQKSFAERFGSKNSFSSSNILDNKSDNSQNSNLNQEPKKPVDPQKRALAQYIYLVKGIDAGRSAWYYVLVEKLKVQLFLKALTNEIIQLEQYGKVLYSAYGSEPPSSITQLIKNEYGIAD